MYDVQPDGRLHFVDEFPSFGEHDGPRHVVPSPDGKKLYVVTEHTSWVDVYAVGKASLEHLQRLSVIPLGELQSGPCTAIVFDSGPIADT